MEAHSLLWSRRVFRGRGLRRRGFRSRKGRVSSRSRKQKAFVKSFTRQKRATFPVQLFRSSLRKARKGFTSIPRAQKRLLLQATPDNILSNDDYILQGTPLIKSFFCITLATSLRAIADAVLEFNNDTGGYPAQALLNSFTTIMMQNVSDVTVKVTEYRYVARTDNSDTTSLDLSGIMTDAGFSQYDTVPSNFYQYPEVTNILDNVVFWRLHKPFKPRTRIIRPGKVMCFNTYSRAFLNLSDLAVVGAYNNPNDGMIRGKTIRAFYVVQAEQAGLCSHNTENPEDVLYLRQPAWEVNVRAMTRIKSRMIELVFPSIRGTLHPDGQTVSANAHPLVPAPGHELHFARSEAQSDNSTDYANAARQVMNPRDICSDLVYPMHEIIGNTPIDVNIIGQPIDVNVIP